MSKVTLSTIASGFGSTDKLNSNFDAIEDGFDNTLSRDGSTPNTMEAAIDMNSQHILNLPAPATATEPARLADLSALTSAIGSTTATLVSVTDTAGLYTGTNVEAALSEAVVTGNINQTVNGNKTFSGTTAHQAVTATTVGVTGQITSTVATGSAPLVVASTTKVTNLNADLLDGLTTDSTQTPSTVVVRDAAGRFRAVDPSNAQDVATKAYVTTATANTSGLRGFAYATSSSSDSTSTTMPTSSGAPPAATDGKEFLTVTYTPVSASSLLRVRFFVPVTRNSSAAGAAERVIALYRDGAAAFAATEVGVYPGGDAESDVCAMSVEGIVASVATTATTFKVRFGPTGGTMYMNLGNNGANSHWGAATLATLSVEEIIP